MAKNTGSTIKEIAEESGIRYARLLKAVHELGFETPTGKGNQLLLSATDKKSVISKVKADEQARLKAASDKEKARAEKATANKKAKA